MSDTPLESTIENLAKAVRKSTYSTWQLAGRGFITGLFTSLGATVGLSLFAGLISFILNQLRIIPGFGDMLNMIEYRR